ncbi:PRC-barrel domain-containing protein [Stakelama saccharophila]|uniref:PRC-barrel domain-containing protein n=1 Tax=Stakelama saccharophila TaxID=3075605 RepID=A0ABZ0BC68_9SPHN|nr:PRC-barrel domain-containing protein [Stakelama sp. W311]WNO54989.1 PRC-barrel domain-containing protein [Stakelama sp. W311]
MSDESLHAGRLIASDRVEGTSAYSRDGEKLGQVERFMIDKASGQVEYVILSFGGILGLSGHYYPLPWQALTYDISRRGYILNVTRAEVEDGPRYQSDPPQFDEEYGRMLYGHYGFTYM